jgi:hypothetical protein
LKNEDLIRTTQELGQGNGGSVARVEHIHTGTIMEKKVGVSHSRSFRCPFAFVGFRASIVPFFFVHRVPFRSIDHLTLSRSSSYLGQLTLVFPPQIVLTDAEPSVRRQILRELQIMHNRDSPYTISC